MGPPIIVWPPCGGSEEDPCQSEIGINWFDCSEYYENLLQPGEIACCSDI